MPVRGHHPARSRDHLAGSFAVDPATISRRDGREEYDQIADVVWCRMTVGITPDKTACIIFEERLTRHGERDASAPLAVQAVWGYDLLTVARYDRDRLLTNDWTLPSGSLTVRDATG